MIRLRVAVAVAVVAVCGVAAPAQTLYVTEPFSVSSGNLATQGSGIGWTPTGTTATWSATSGTFTAAPGTGQTYSGLLTSGNSVNSSSVAQYSRQVASAASSGATDFWASFLITTNASANTEYAGVSLGNVFIGKPSNTANWGVDHVGATTGSLTASTVAATAATTLLVAHFTGTGTTLYINPTNLGGASPSGGSPVTNSLVSTLDGQSVQLFNGSSSTVLSDLRFGDSFAAVTPVPEPMTVGLLASAGLGLVRLRRRLV